MWYVIWTTTGREEYTRQMINTYADPSLFTRCAIPYRLKKHFYKGKTSFVKIILFPSYVFIETDHIREFVNNIKWFPGFNVVLHMEDVYCPVQKHEEFFLTKLINERDVIDISEGYLVGDRVIVTSGPLVGQEGNIKKVNRRKGTAILEMNIFNRITEVCLGLELIRENKK